MISSFTNLISDVLKISIPLFLFFKEDISLEISIESVGGKKTASVVGLRR